MAADPLIRVTDLRKAFGAHVVLDGVALDVHAGEAVALLGPNGAGKTTLLKILATLLRPTRGSARIVGHDSVRDAAEVRRWIALLAHGAYVYEDLTALENLRFWTAMAGVAQPADRLVAALAEVELEDAAGERVRRFSAGMKRRLSLARLILTRPRVLLLDEPFAGLDQRAQKWLEQFLQAFKEQGGAMVMATHSFGRGLEPADRIAILAQGRIAFEARRADLGDDALRRLYAAHTEGVA